MKYTLTKLCSYAGCLSDKIILIIGLPGSGWRHEDLILIHL